jgi:hypothetical protein
MAASSPQVATTEWLIALGNLRSSAIKCADLLAETESALLSGACATLNAALVGAGPVEVRDRVDAELATETTGLCEASEAVIHASRVEARENEALHVALQRLANDVCIARSVLARAIAHSDQDPRASAAASVSGGRGNSQNRPAGVIRTGSSSPDD